MRTEFMMIVLTTGLLLAACDRSDEDASALPAPLSPDTLGEATAEDLVSCNPTRLVQLIEGIALEDDESGCRVLLPAEPAAGTYRVEISGAGATDIAAIEAMRGDERLVGTRGEVIIEASENGILRGRIAAEDHIPPGTGRIEGTFEVPNP